MSVHERPVGATVEWRTPRSLFDKLKVSFDLDPAAFATQTWSDLPARRRFTREDDGLSKAWIGHVWLNPPYGREAISFVLRMIEHDDGMLLLPSRTETRLYQLALAASTAVCFLADRLWFTRDDGFTGRSSFGSTLFAFGGWAEEALLAAGLGATIRLRPGEVRRVFYRDALGRPIAWRDVDGPAS